MDAARRARLGQKWSCFSCGRKFYDLNREEPICPRCETDQRNAPPPEKRIGAKKASKKKATKKKTTKKAPAKATIEAPAKATIEAPKKATKEAPKKATKKAPKRAPKKATSDPSPALGDEEELAPDDLELGIDEVEDIDLNEADLGDDTDVAKGKPAG